MGVAKVKCSWCGEAIWAKQAVKAAVIWLPVECDKIVTNNCVTLLCGECNRNFKLVYGNPERDDSDHVIPTFQSLTLADRLERHYQ